MAEDKATMEAINNLSSMFPGIDKEMVTDIFLGCKKDFDKTIDQLIGMGAELEKTPPAKSPVHTPKVPSPVISPKLSVQTPKLPEPQVSSPKEPSHFTDVEKERLEILNQQLSQEYRRLADTQEKNLLLEKQLAITQASIAAERQKLDEEKRRFEEQQDAFLQDKKRLEEHLSSRLREMKEQMRRSEEELRAKEYEKRVQEELSRQEERKAEEEMRIAEKALRKEAKLRIKEEKKSRKVKSQEIWYEEEQAKMEKHSEEQQALIEKLRAEFYEKEAQLKAENNALHEALEEMEHSVVVNQQSSQESMVESLQFLSNWLNKGVEHLQRKSISPASLKEELINSLQQSL